MKKQQASRRVAVGLWLTLMCTVAFAQVQNGVFTGTVTESTGAVVPGAKLTITNVDTGLTTTATTSGAGTYTSPALPPGTYKVSVEASGFKKTTTSAIKLDVGTKQRLDVKLQVGAQTETVEVTAEAPQVNVDDSKLSAVVNSTQIANLPLNGRNVYDLLQVAPGAVNVKGVLSENGAGTVVNGVRENFNGFLINGVNNKGLSGGANNQPIEDTVQEFQLLTLNNSAQYGSSAGSVTNLVTKSGTNAFHGSVFEFLRNDIFDANNFFNNHFSKPTDRVKPPLRFNQFGATFGGPVIKDKLFFYGAYQGDRFVTSTLPNPVDAESAEFRSAVIAAQPNSVAALLYQNFTPTAAASSSQTIADYFGTDLGFWLCPDNSNAAIAGRIASIVGVTAADDFSTCSTTPLPSAGTFNRALPFRVTTINIAKTRTQGNLFQGNEASGRIDFNPNQNNRFFVQFNWARTRDEFLAGPTGGRGFTNPQKITSPNGQFNFVHTFSPSVINEFRAGYSGNVNGINTALPGVPAIGFDDGTLGFGSYNGYPQFFKENVYNYGDMLSINKNKHSMKVGLDVRRNIENSEFNVGRPSYYFFDQLFFAADAPYNEAAGINPDIANGGTGANAHLESNVRHWRNWEYGAYFQDDWKVTSRLTLNLGIRYDLYQRHTELNKLATTFILGPGNNLIDNITTGAGQIKDANTPSASCTAPNALQRSVLAGVCGPGGFAPAKSLGKGDHNNWGPKVGFAWDVFGNSKTSLRGGYGLSYEGTLYNPLSNSRWNPPYYSFNNIENFLDGDVNNVLYGPASGGAPRFTGPADPLNHQGTGSTAVGNIMGWDTNNPNQAVLTGIIFPKGIKDPYVHNWFLGVQHEIAPTWAVEADYVGTAGHKLFRAENVNRVPGSVLGSCSTTTMTCTNPCAVDTFGRTVCGHRDFVNNPSGRRLNPNYGRLRVWENVVNSNYHAMQLQLKKAARQGLAFNINYTWSHAIDGGSTWHSGATSANGAAGGEGFTTDQTIPNLDRSNSIYDIRHRLVANYVYELPFFKNDTGPLNWILGGWQLNGIISYQSGAHWSPFCSSGTRCDLNKDGERNDRPNADVNHFNPSHDQWANGWAFTDPTWTYCNTPSRTCTVNGVLITNSHFWGTGSTGASPGNLGRNNFVGPSFVAWDPSVFKNFKFTERVRLQFRWEVFNALNHTNFQLPGANGAGRNAVQNSNFGQAGGTFDSRKMQFGIKISF